MTKSRREARRERRAPSRPSAPRDAGPARGPGRPGERARATSGDWGRALLVSALLALATYAIYAQLGAHEFLHFDDDEYIYNNPHVRTGLGSKNIAWALTAF